MEANVIVTEQRVRGERWVRKEAEGVEPVVDGDDYDVGRLVYPVLKGPVSGVAIDVT